jgi:hypothetical protein
LNVHDELVAEAGVLMSFFARLKPEASATQMGRVGLRLPRLPALEQQARQHRSGDHASSFASATAIPRDPEEFDEAIPESDWPKMVTENPAEALAVEDKIGRIAVGLKADLLVLARRDDDPNRSLLKNEIQDVQWVMIGGEPAYGNEAGIQKVRPDQCEALTVHGSRKRLCVRKLPASVEK